MGGGSDQVPGGGQGVVNKSQVGGGGRCSDLVPGGEGVDVLTWSWGGRG